MSYLVTGDRGFVGSRLKKFIEERGETAVGLDMLGDYPTVDVLRSFMKQNCVTKVFHLGARAFIPDCFGSAILDVVNSNVVMTANLLVACKKCGVEKFVYLSTSEVYGTPKKSDMPLNEESRVNPQSTYAATKYAAESLVRTFGRETGMDVVILRHFNIYGPGDTHPRVIPKIMSALKNRKEKILMGSIEVTRDFTYVDDVCQELANLMEHTTDNGEIFVGGSGVETSIDELINMLLTIYGGLIRIEHSEKMFRPWDVKRLQADATKYNDRFPEHGYNRVSLKDGLILTKEWYDCNEWSWESKETRE